MTNPPAFLQYHLSFSDLLEENGKELWDWFSSDKFTAEAYEAQRLYLLKIVTDLRLGRMQNCIPKPKLLRNA